MIPMFVLWKMISALDRVATVKLYRYLISILSEKELHVHNYCPCISLLFRTVVRAGLLPFKVHVRT